MQGEDDQDDDTGEVEVLDAEPKNLILSIIAQLRPGMDLSRVTLPVFILEPKSFLEKLTDFMTHPDLLVGLKLETPEERLIAITRFYLSGFYIRPKGVKKPYTPQLGEVFRCHWNHKNSKSFYVSEQVSRLPDISAFYGSNRHEGFVVNGTITFRDKFLGNSASVDLEGEARLYLLEYDEIYYFTFPTAYARGLLWGTLCMELGGNIYVRCDKSGYRSDIEFKTKGFWGGEYNCIAGTIKKGQVDQEGNWERKQKTLHTFEGKWDGRITIRNEKTKEEEIFWDPEAGMAPKSKMIVRSLKDQSEWDSRKLWQKVSRALQRHDTEAAADEKIILDTRTRQLKEQAEEGAGEFEPKYFERDEDGEWVYKYLNLTKWSAKEKEELEEIEEDGVIKVVPKASLTKGGRKEGAGRRGRERTRRKRGKEAKE